MADLAKAMNCNPKGDEPYFLRAVVRVPLSIWGVIQRQDIEPLYRDSLADLEQALKLNPGLGETWLGRANIHLAWANFQAGNETNALFLFNGFIDQFPRSPLAPQAQWWIADHFYRAGEFVSAEKNYENVYPTFSPRALLRVALHRFGNARF